MKNASIPEYRAFLKNLVAAFDPHGAETYCNFFLHSCASAFGARGFFSTEKNRVLMANEMVDFLKVNQGQWKKFSGDYKSLVQDLCTSPMLAVAAQKADIHGHVCILTPEPVLIQSGKWGKDVPQAANVGKTNFYGKGLNFAFGKEPEIFVYVGA